MIRGISLFCICYFAVIFHDGKAQAAPVAEYHFSDCFTLTQIDPTRAFEYAVSWQEQSSEHVEKAELCKAAALIELKNFEAAGVIYHDLAVGQQDQQQEKTKGLYVSAATAYAMDRSYEQAEQNFAQALAVSKQDNVLLMRAAMVSSLAGDDDQALAYLGKIILDDLPTEMLADYYLYRAKSYEGLGDVPAAAKAFKEGVAAHIHQPLFYIHYSHFLLEQGDRSQAAAILAQIKRDPLAEDLQEMVQALDQLINLD